MSEEKRTELEQAWEKSSGKPLVWEDSETDGVRFYGTHSDCIVLFSPGHMQGLCTENIGGYEFAHSSSFSIYAYKDGQFLTLEKAYDKQWLSQEQIASIAEYHSAWNQKALDELEAGDHPEYLSKEKKVELQTEWLKYSGLTADWYTDDLSWQTRYYGEHDGYDIILHSISPDTGTGAVEIAGRVFFHSHNFHLVAYRDGEFLPLADAYKDGLISEDAIEAIYQIHKPLQDMIFGPDGPTDTAVPTTTASVPTTEPVDTEMEYFLELFRSSEERNPYNYALRVMYDFASPEELDLLSFYDGGFDGEHEITDEEWAEYSKLVADPENVHGDFNRLPRDKIEAELQAVFGISLADLPDSAFRGLFYLECSDSYCFNQSGMTSKSTYGGFLDIIHNDDGTVSLIYEDPDGKCAITLKPNGDSYLVVSNVHIE